MGEEKKPDDVDELMKLIGVDPEKIPRPELSQAREPALRETAPGKVEFPPVVDSGGPRPEAGLDLLGDVNVNLKVELGRSRMFVQDILKLGAGSVVPLETLTGDPLDIYVNDRLVARGEVLVVNDNFAVRITEVVSPPKGP